MAPPTKKEVQELVLRLTDTAKAAKTTREEVDRIANLARQMVRQRA